MLYRSSVNHDGMQRIFHIIHSICGHSLFLVPERIGGLKLVYSQDVLSAFDFPQFVSQFPSPGHGNGTCFKAHQFNQFVRALSEVFIAAESHQRRNRKNRDNQCQCDIPPFAARHFLHGQHNRNWQGCLFKTEMVFPVVMVADSTPERVQHSIFLVRPADSPCDQDHKSRKDNSRHSGSHRIHRLVPCQSENRTDHIFESTECCDTQSDSGQGAKQRNQSCLHRQCRPQFFYGISAGLQHSCIFHASLDKIPDAETDDDHGYGKDNHRKEHYNTAHNHRYKLGSASHKLPADRQIVEIVAFRMRVSVWGDQFFVAVRDLFFQVRC